MVVAAHSQCEGTTAVDLLERECGPYMFLDGITTITFFAGPVPLEQLKERVVKVVQASPWLAGKLAKKNKEKGQKEAQEKNGGEEAKPGNVQMVFDSAPTAEQVLDRLFFEMELDISTAMPCEALNAKIEGTTAHIKDIGFCLVKKGLPYTRFTVARKDASSWALVFSLSHTVADGYTYYKILSMLSMNEEITHLIPTRKHSIVPALKKAVGARESDISLGAAPLLMNYVCNLVFGGKPRVRAFYVDANKVQEAKARSSGTDFVSTNDVLTAFWGRLTGARLLEMPMNFRGRLHDLKADDAGNYQGCILFSNADCADPANIRRALQRGDGKYQSADPPQPLPGLSSASASIASSPIGPPFFLSSALRAAPRPCTSHILIWGRFPPICSTFSGPQRILSAPS
mmetsp:Transcript_87051/g.244123  ORF Transcript_87051/g.244123 Transcript_87051/m.244123 type:complete len:401 (+) Transcript_87051:74-1276(+)